MSYVIKRDQDYYTLCHHSGILWWRKTDYVGTYSSFEKAHTAMNEHITAIATKPGTIWTYDNQGCN